MSILTCELCRNDYPIARFPKLDVGVICDGCMTGQSMTNVDRAMKAKAISMAKEVAVIRGVQAELPKLKSVLSSVYDQFGGPGGYAQYFYWVIMELSKKRPLSPQVAQLMLGFMKLHHSLEQTEETTAAREMTDEQLRRETELATIRLLVDSAGDPEKRAMLESVLGKHGLKLTDADASEVIEATAKALNVEVTHKQIEEQVQSFMEKDYDSD